MFDYVHSIRNAWKSDIKNGMRSGLYVALTMIISIILFIFSGRNPGEEEINSLARNEPGEGEKVYNITAEIDGLLMEDFEISIPERKYSFEECKSFEDKYVDEIIKRMLCNNEDLLNVESDLFFFNSMENCPYEIQFESEYPDKLDDYGKILTDEEFDVSIKINLSYEEFKDLIVIMAHVVPGPSVRVRVYRDKLSAKLRDSEDVTDNTVNLPTEIAGKIISYMVPASKKNPFFLVIGFITSIGIILGEKRDERKRRNKRRNEIAKEYPVLLQKMALYLAAGMTIKGAWFSIYEEKGKEKSKNPLYAEMKITINEIQSGISEGMAYKHFGERSELMEIIRFTALISQNLKKGSSKLREILNQESENANLIKKQKAIQAGEQAGTKLLAPMMILLLDVLMMIIVPAFWNI